MKFTRAVAEYQEYCERNKISPSEVSWPHSSRVSPHIWCLANPRGDHLACVSKARVLLPNFPTKR